MQRIALAGSLVLIFTVAGTAEGQGVGGLIRKKVEQATKPKEEQAAKNTDQEPTLFSFEPSAEAMASYKRGLEVEIRMLNEYRDRLAKLKTREQYQACEQGAATSPDALKLAEETSARMDKATAPEELQKVYLWQNERFKAIALKQCGEDPRPLLNQRGEILIKAEAAGATEAGRGWKRKPSRDEETSSREESESAGTAEGQLEDGVESADHAPASPFASAPASPGARQQASSEEILKDYRTAKEFIVKYCSLSPEMRNDAEQRGIRAPGTGNNIYWIFPRWFALWVGSDCDHLIKLYTMLEEAASPPPK